MLSSQRHALDEYTVKNEDLIIFSAESFREFIEYNYRGGKNMLLWIGPDRVKIMRDLPVFAQALPRPQALVDGSDVSLSYRPLPRRYMFPLLDLPDEIIYDIAQDLSGQGFLEPDNSSNYVLPLTLTCKRIRVITSPWIFETLRLPGRFHRGRLRNFSPNWNHFPTQRVKRLAISRGPTDDSELVAEELVSILTPEQFSILQHVAINLSLKTERLIDIVKSLSLIISLRFITFEFITVDSRDKIRDTEFPISILHLTLEHIPSWLTGLRLPLLSQLDGRICRIITQLHHLNVLHISPYATPEFCNDDNFEDEYEWTVRKLIIGDWEPYMLRNYIVLRHTPFNVILKILRFVASSVEILILNGFYFKLEDTLPPERLDPIPFSQLSTLKLQLVNPIPIYENMSESSVTSEILRKIFSSASVIRFQTFQSYFGWAIRNRIPLWPSLRFAIRGFRDTSKPLRPTIYEYWNFNDGGPFKVTVTNIDLDHYYPGKISMYTGIDENP